MTYDPCNPRPNGGSPAPREAGDPGRSGESTQDVDPGAQVVAFYLPQYHRIPENDEWWGEGFTDWTNVKRALPLFKGHEQPRVPTTLGYYDLGDVDVHHAQADLARGNGVAAFCYYAYWFAGRRLLEQPLELVGANPDLRMPYAICWANEPWSRRWDGSEAEILMEQRHSPGQDAAFIDDMAKHLGDSRYLRVGGRPLLLIYRAGLLRDPLRTTDGLRERALRLGLGDLFLTMVQSFGSWEPAEYGFDAAVEFPPHPHNLGIDPLTFVNRTRGVSPKSTLWTPSMEDAIRVALSRPVPDFTWFRTVMPGWDNTPRRGSRGIVYVGATPDLFRRWLEDVLRCTYLFRPPGERYVFVNAWNEWAEGAYLEPDAAHGDAYLRIVGEALEATRAFAADTKQLMAAGRGEGGLLEAARGAWTGRGGGGRFRLQWTRSAEPGSFADLDMDDVRAVKATLWAMTKLRTVPPAYSALRRAARLMGSSRRRLQGRR